MMQYDVTQRLLHVLPWTMEVMVVVGGGGGDGAHVMTVFRSAHDDWRGERGCQRLARESWRDRERRVCSQSCPMFTCAHPQYRCTCINHKKHSTIIIPVYTAHTKHNEYQYPHFLAETVEVEESGETRGVPSTANLAREGGREEGSGIGMGV